MTLRFKQLPHDENRNGWLGVLPARIPAPRLQQDTEADWVVVGAGFAGLAFARRLATLQPSARILLLDAGVVGDNASGRNSGFVIDLPHNIGTSTAELQSAGHYRRLLRAGLQTLEDQVRQHGIACDWQQQGKYHATVHPGHSALLDQYANELSLLDEPFSLLEQEELAGRLGTGFYHRALYTPNAVLLNPAALTQGLAAHLPDNVQLHELTPVQSISTGRRIEVQTPFGRIRAGKLMLATNGAAAQLKGFGALLTSFATFASLSAPLSAAQRERLGHLSPWGLTPANAIAGATLRYTPDHRFLVREHVRFSPSLQTDAADTARRLAPHRALFLRRYPQLADLGWEHTWSGLITVTRHGAPRWGQVAPNLYVSLGCNGAGASKQTIAGSLLADLATGNEHPLLANMLALGQPGWLPPRPILDIGAQGYLLKERWAGRHDR